MSDRPNHLLPPGITRESIEETRQVFESEYGKPLTDDDCIEIIQNAWGLFEFLYPDGIVVPDPPKDMDSGKDSTEPGGPNRRRAGRQSGKKRPDESSGLA